MPKGQDSKSMARGNPGRLDARFRTQFRKTELCSFFQRGTCSRGSACNYAHGEDELQVAPDLTKTSLCKKWVKFLCPHSREECPFAHGFQELRATGAYVTPKGSKPSSDSPTTALRTAMSDGEPRRELTGVPDSADHTPISTGSASPQGRPTYLVPIVAAPVRVAAAAAPAPIWCCPVLPAGPAPAPAPLKPAAPAAAAALQEAAQAPGVPDPRCAEIVALLAAQVNAWGPDALAEAMQRAAPEVYED